jgi:ribosomal protein S18 acetylase RimI-like enzyme
MARSGCARSHAVIFFPEDQTGLIAEASTRGERVTWDLVMVAAGQPPQPQDDRVEEVGRFDDAFWRAHASSARLFEVEEPATVAQLQALERDVMIPGGRRWFTVRGAGEPEAFAALLVLGASAYLDHVVTFPAARRRGHAEALTRRALSEAAGAGATRTFLLAEPGGAARRIYARLGFARLGYLASWLSPIAR